MTNSCINNNLQISSYPMCFLLCKTIYATNRSISMSKTEREKHWQSEGNTPQSGAIPKPAAVSQLLYQNTKTLKCIDIVSWVEIIAGKKYRNETLSGSGREQRKARKIATIRTGIYFLCLSLFVEHTARAHTKFDSEANRKTAFFYFNHSAFISRFIWHNLLSSLKSII